ncbi:MAG: bifunctional phosphopantothenoylcysteine decarboxylase/phosphopantothenate--cysteine ligase CoaBC [Gemmatimonadota bacterium]
MPDRVLSLAAPWEGRRVLLGVSGGIAAYKAVQVARDLTLLGAEVDTILTRSAHSFVGPLSFSGVTGREVFTELLSGAGAALHLALASAADLVLVAPATADLIARAAQGRSNDLLASVLLATRAPVLLAPAMNDRMYSHPQTSRNVLHCRDTLGYGILGPATGPLAVGEGSGAGRMLEPWELVDHAGRALGLDSAFADRHVLVTAGPTQEPIDPVRYVGNRSSGKMGFALAREAWLRGAEVTLVTGPTALPDPVGIRTVRVETAEEMHREVRGAIGAADIAIFAAAVADYRPEAPKKEKWKRSDAGEGPTLSLVENADIARDTRALRRDGAVVVGFALETRDLVAGARTKLQEKGFDLVVANDPGEEGAAFGSPTNRVTLLDAEGGEDRLPLLSKERVATEVLARVRGILVRRDPTAAGDVEE